MNKSNELKEFEIFGQKVRFRPDASSGFEPEEVIALLNKIDSEVDPENKLSNQNKLLLATLKVAGENFKLKNLLKENVSEIEHTLDEAIDFVSKFSLGNEDGGAPKNTLIN